MPLFYLLRALAARAARRHVWRESPGIDTESKRIAPERERAALVARDFEVWHTFTTYFDGPIDDLAAAAERLVASGVADLAMLTDGRTIWRGTAPDHPVGFGLTLFEPHDDGMRHTVRFVPGKGAPAREGFALEAWFQASQFVSAEGKLFVGDRDVVPPAARLFLGACMVGDEATGRIWLYPIVNLYESGVVMVHFRMLSSVSAAPLDVLIRDYVNLGRRSFEAGEVPTAIAKLAPRASRVGYHASQALKNPLTRWWKGRMHDAAIDDLSWTHESGDFTWHLSPLSRSAMGEGETLAGIAHAVFDVLGHLAGRPRRLRTLPWGSPGQLVKGNYWIARPYVHLVRFEGQRETATATEDQNALDFARLIMRTSGDVPPDRVRAHLPKDMRTFEDANAYLTLSLGLFAWSGRGVERHGAPLATRNSYLIESQVKAEAVEHANMLARALYEASSQRTVADRVFELRSRLLRLRNGLDAPSPYGEVNDLIRNALANYGFPSTIAKAEEWLALREAEAVAEERRRDERARRALTLLFGLIAAPTLGTAIVGPLWKWAGMDVPGPSVAQPLVFTAVAGALLFVLAVAVVGVARRSRVRSATS